MTGISTVCLLGFGEVGQILAEDLSNPRSLRRGGGIALSVWDGKFADADSGPSRAAHSRTIRLGSDGADAARGGDVVSSAVTAAQDVEAARAILPGLKSGAYFLDLNSASPEMKKSSARLIEEAGGRYVEAAVMSPFPPKRLASPMLLGGPHAEDFIAASDGLGFTGMRLFSTELGRASAAKMCRSVMVKGIEALLTESLVTARHYGVEATVLASLNDLFPLGDWRKLATYMIQRSLEHGTRRAEELREVARTVADAGMDSWMSSATAERQDWAASRRAALSAENLEAMLDQILASTRESNAC